MPEKPPVTKDNLYDDSGKVKDIAAAHEMAKLEGSYREIDGDRIFAPGKEERSEREAALKTAGMTALEAKRQREMEDDAEARQRQEKREYETFVRRNLEEGGWSGEDWTTSSAEERARLERSWRRKEQRSPEWALEQRLQSLVGRQITSFDVGDFGDIKLRTEDGLTLGFTSWDLRRDAPDYDGVRIEKKGQNSKEVA